MRQLRWFLLMVTVLLILQATLTVNASSPPAFVVITTGFWGSMDRLPSNSPEWLAGSPYPHYRKHQDASFLTGSDYRPIPQKYLKTGRGPSLGLLVINSYYLMERELEYWAKRANRQAGYERIKIFDDWQVLERGKDDQGREISPGEINIIYLKYDWRLDLPQIERDYARPFISFIDQRWPGAELHWVGHSLGGLVGSYVVTSHPGRFTSLITIGSPHYGIHEIGAQLRGERITYGNRWDLEKSQQIGLWIVERIYFRTKIVKTGKQFIASARKFAETYLPMMRWMDPQDLQFKQNQVFLRGGNDAVRHAVALYGLGFGSYDLQGNYHSRLEAGPGIGPAEEPGPNKPEYACSGDGRVDPVSARGPFRNTLCLGRDKPHGSLMWSPLVLTFLIDRYFYQGQMKPEDLNWSFRRLGVTGDQKSKCLKWLDNSRTVWDKGN